MTITVSDTAIGYEVAMKDPFQSMIVKHEEKQRERYEGNVYYLDSCGEGDTYLENVDICRRCANRDECLKRWE